MTPPECQNATLVINVNRLDRDDKPQTSPVRRTQWA